MQADRKLVEALKEAGLTFTVETTGKNLEYTDIYIKASASDKELTIVFENGKYQYSQ